MLSEKPNQLCTTRVLRHCLNIVHIVPARAHLNDIGTAVRINQLCAQCTATQYASITYRLYVLYEIV